LGELILVSSPGCAGCPWGFAGECYACEWAVFYGSMPINAFLIKKFTIGGNLLFVIFADVKNDISIKGLVQNKIKPAL
jgi:hypothetical protein